MTVPNKRAQSQARLSYAEREAQPQQMGEWKIKRWWIFSLKNFLLSLCYLKNGFETEPIIISLKLDETVYIGALAKYREQIKTKLNLKRTNQ